MRVDTLLNHMEHYKGFVYDVCELNRETDTLEVLVRERGGVRVACPRCGRRCTVYDHLPPRLPEAPGQPDRQATRRASEDQARPQRARHEVAASPASGSVRASARDGPPGSPAKRVACGTCTPPPPLQSTPGGKGLRCPRETEAQIVPAIVRIAPTAVR